LVSLPSQTQAQLAKSCSGGQKVAVTTQTPEQHSSVLSQQSAPQTLAVGQHDPEAVPPRHVSVALTQHSTPHLVSPAPQTQAQLLKSCSGGQKPAMVTQASEQHAWPAPQQAVPPTQTREVAQQDPDAVPPTHVSEASRQHSAPHLVSPASHRHWQATKFCSGGQKPATVTQPPLQQTRPVPQVPGWPLATGVETQLRFWQVLVVHGLPSSQSASTQQALFAMQTPRQSFCPDGQPQTPLMHGTPGQWLSLQHWTHGPGGVQRRSPLWQGQPSGPGARPVSLQRQTQFGPAT
jgi:hypothetical protein